MAQFTSRDSCAQTGSHTSKLPDHIIPHTLRMATTQKWCIGKYWCRCGQWNVDATSVGAQNGIAAVSNGNSAFNLWRTPTGWFRKHTVGMCTLQRPEGREGLGDNCLQQHDPLSDNTQVSMRRRAKHLECILMKYYLG